MIEVRRDGRVVDEPLHAVRGRPHGLLWVRATAPTSAEVEALAKAFHLHPLAVEDILNRNQRPKIDDYPQHLFVVLFGAVPTSGLEIELVEIHVAAGDGYVLTIADRELPALEALATTIDRRPEQGAGSADLLLYRVADAVVDSLLPILDTIDAGIDSVENEIITHPRQVTLRRVFTLKRDLNALRRVLGPQRDLLQSLTSPRSKRIGEEAQLYLRDVYDHTVRIAEELDGFRDTVTSALDVYLSSVSNRLGEQTRRLTVVATIFLPLTFLTGFFGMNFAFLVGAISTTLAFAIGMVAMAVSVAVVLLVVIVTTRRAQPIPTDEKVSLMRMLPRRGRRAQPRDAGR